MHKDYVLDYSSALKDVIMEVEQEAGVLTYRYAYGLEKAHVVIYGVGNTGSGFQPFGSGNGPGASLETYVMNGFGEWELDSSEGFPLSDIMETHDYSAPGSIIPFGSGPAGTDIVKLYYHHDRLGSTDFLTSNTDGKIRGYISRDDWGQPDVKKMVLNTGTRELNDLLLQYTAHPYDLVLGIYYAQARMYDAANRRFMAVDLLGINIAIPSTHNEYAYVRVIHLIIMIIRKYLYTKNLLMAALIIKMIKDCPNPKILLLMNRPIPLVAPRTQLRTP